MLFKKRMTSINQRISPNKTAQAVQIKEIEQLFNLFRSGSETLADVLRMTPQEYDALIHGESSLGIEQIDRLVEIGVDLGSLFDANKKVVP